jgi:carbonic anhydrase
LIKVNYGEEFLTIKLNIRFINNKTNKDEHDNKRNARFTPLMALEILKGNSRFINNLKANRNLLQQANDTMKDNIHLVVLSCIDPELRQNLF